MVSGSLRARLSGGAARRAGGLTPFSPAEGQGCTAYDVAVNSDFYRRMQVGGVAAGEAWAGAAPLSLEPSRSPLPALS